MHLGLDLDSVLADLMPDMNQFVFDRYKLKLELSDYTDYALSNIWKIPETEVVDRILEFYDSPYFAAIKPVAGAVQGINFLSKQHQLTIITSRPDSITSKTHAWINHYFPNCFHRVYLTNQLSKSGSQHTTKGAIALSLKLDAFVDDHYGYAQDVASQGIKSFLYTQPWNQKYLDLNQIKRVLDWPDLLTQFSQV